MYEIQALIVNQVTQETWSVSVDGIGSILRHGARKNLPIKKGLSLGVLDSGFYLCDDLIGARFFGSSRWCTNQNLMQRKLYRRVNQFIHCDFVFYFFSFSFSFSISTLFIMRGFLSLLLLNVLIVIVMLSSLGSVAGQSKTDAALSTDSSFFSIILWNNQKVIGTVIVIVLSYFIYHGFLRTATVRRLTEEPERYLKAIEEELPKKNYGTLANLYIGASKSYKERGDHVNSKLMLVHASQQYIGEAEVEAQKGNHEAAAMHYEKAAQYCKEEEDHPKKVIKIFKLAAEMYVKVAEENAIHQNRRPHTAAAYTSAARCYTSAEDSVNAEKMTSLASKFSVY